MNYRLGRNNENSNKKEVNMLKISLFGLGFLFVISQLYHLFSAKIYKTLIIGSQTILLEENRPFAELTNSLAGRSGMRNYEGMIVSLDRYQKVILSTEKVLFPLDVIFLSGNKINQIAPNLPPCGEFCSTYYLSSNDVNGFIQLNGGQAKALNLKVGDVLDIEKK